jgi:GntR family transcriptional regulator
MDSGRKVARYREIADYLRERIIDGTFPPGQPLPSEEQLAKEFGVTRPTVRQGIAELRAAGLVEVIMGRGMFVRSPHARPQLTRARGVRRDKTGHYTEADAIRWTTTDEPVATRTDAPVALADLLRIPPGEPMFTYDQHQTADHGRLRQLHRTHIPFSILVGTPYEDTAPPPAPALFTALESLGHQLHYTEYVRTRMPLPDEATTLRLSEGVPLLHLLRLTLNQHDRPLALEETRIPGDDLELAYAMGSGS